MQKILNNLFELDNKKKEVIKQYDEEIKDINISIQKELYSLGIEIPLNKCAKVSRNLLTKVKILHQVIKNEKMDFKKRDLRESFEQDIRDYLKRKTNDN